MQTKKFISVLLTLLMMAGVIAVAPVTASAIDVAGDKVTFGTYPQSWYYPEYPVLPPESPALGSVYTFSDGTVAMFNGSNYNIIEPIEWRVLASEGGKLLLFAEKVLDVQQYYTALIGMTWENSSMRAFLNGGSGNPCGYSFIGLAFNTAEKAAIQTTTVHTPDNVPDKTYGGNDTQDKLFLLSTEELGEYGVTRVAAGTNFLGFGSGQDGEASAWFLRSPGQGIKYDTGEEPPWSNSEGVMRVFSDGTLAHQGVNQLDGVRPAMWVDASALTTGTAPGITGPAALTLTAGYAAQSTGAYTITGTAPVTVTKQSGDAKITWNNTTKKLDIAAGLAAGTYPVTLKASNGVNPDATFTFTLTVTAASTYAVTVICADAETAGGGNYAAGDTVSISVGTPPAGKVFKEWTATPAVTFANKNSTSTTFTMPASAVTVTAVFENASSPSNTIFGTGYEATFFNWILFFIGFGWIWMWFI